MLKSFKFVAVTLASKRCTFMYRYFVGNSSIVLTFI